MKQTLKAGAAVSAFAHLLGWSPKVSAGRAEDDDRKEDAVRAEEDDADDEDRKDTKKGKKAKAGEDDEDEPGDDPDKAKSAKDDDGEDDADSKKGKKAKASDDDEECEDDEDDYAEGKKAERARWAKVLKSPAAAQGRVAAACEMLANTSMTAKAVIATLQALPAGSSRTSLRERMETEKTPNVGSGDPAADKPSLGAQIVKAAAKARGDKT